MFKNNLQNIENVSIYPIISMLIFVTFFVALGFFVWKADKKYIKYMEDLPFADEE
jgi:cytochrome c oxidase cbb3-type subunit IV